jgi:carbon monoxide dehydrogenase subunit G
MELEHEFTVPVPKATAWAVLMDVERIAPCMPGATFDGYLGDDHDEGFKGRVKVKLGPITVTYAGTARFAERDEAAGRAVIEASGKEARGPGTASATIRAQLTDQGESTKVSVVTDLNVTGKPAQFGRGVMAEVGGKLVGQFADCLATQLAGDAAAAGDSGTVAAPADSGGEEAAEQHEGPSDGVGTPAAVAPAAAPRTAPAPAPRPTADAIDLLDTAGAPVLKRVLPVLVALLGVFVVWRLLRRRGD